MRPRWWFLPSIASLFGLAVPTAEAQDGQRSVTTAPATGRGFTLEAALSAMHRSHPLLRAATSSIRVAEGNALTAGHWSNPILDASYVQAARNSGYDPVGTLAAGITQFLELTGAPAARRRSGEAEVRATTADRTGLALDLEWAVREAFIRLAATHERQRIRQEAFAELERAATTVGLRVASGMAPRYDASRIRIALEQARADIGESEADSARARGDLDVAVGPAAADLTGTPKIDVTDAPSVPALSVLLDIARTRRPDVVAARQRTEAASFDIDVAKRLVFPGIGIRLGAGYGQSPGQVDLGVAVVAALPIIERGQGTVLAAEARREGRRQVAEALSTAAMQRVHAAHEELAKRAEVLTRFRAETSALNDGMRLEAQAGYREAKLSVLELVDAYQSLRDVRLRLVDLNEAVHLAKAALDRAVGAETITP